VLRIETDCGSRRLRKVVNSLSSLSVRRGQTPWDDAWEIRVEGSRTKRPASTSLPRLRRSTGLPDRGGAPACGGRWWDELGWADRSSARLDRGTFRIEPASASRPRLACLVACIRRRRHLRRSGVSVTTMAFAVSGRHCQPPARLPVSCTDTTGTLAEVGAVGLPAERRAGHNFVIAHGRPSSTLMDLSKSAAAPPISRKKKKNPFSCPVGRVESPRPNGSYARLNESVECITTRFLGENV